MYGIGGVCTSKQEGHKMWIESKKFRTGNKIWIAHPSTVDSVALAGVSGGNDGSTCSLLLRFNVHGLDTMRDGNYFI